MQYIAILLIIAYCLFMFRGKILPLIQNLIDIRNKRVEKVVTTFLLVSSLITILATFMILASILFEAIRFFQKESFFEFLFSSNWAPHGAFLGQEAEFGSVGLFLVPFTLA